MSEKPVLPPPGPNPRPRLTLLRVVVWVVVGGVGLFRLVSGLLGIVAKG